MSKPTRHVKANETTPALSNDAVLQEAAFVFKTLVCWPRSGQL